MSDRNAVTIARCAKKLLFPVLIALSVMGVRPCSGGWQENGNYIAAGILEQAISDGDHGAFILTRDYNNIVENGILLNRIDRFGDYPWVSGPLQLSDQVSDLSNRPAALAIGDDGAVIAAWSADTGAGIAIQAQKVDGFGTVLWNYGGASVCDTLTGGGSPLFVVADDEGGAIVVWRHYADGAALSAQRLGPDGARQWGATGVLFAAQPYDRFAVEPDGAGGVLVAWVDQWYLLHGQRIGASGQTMWEVDGVVFCSVGGDKNWLKTCPDGSGGMIVTWADRRSGSYQLYSQRIASSGTPMWTEDGVPACPVGFTDCPEDVISDGAAGTIIAWTDHRDGQYDPYLQRISSSGVLMWGAGGVRASMSLSDQYSPRLAPGRDGGALVIWADDNLQVDDLRVQRLDGSGNLLWGHEGTKIMSWNGFSDLDFVSSNDASGIVAYNRGWEVFATSTSSGSGLTATDLSFGSVTVGDSVLITTEFRNPLTVPLAIQAAYDNVGPFTFPSSFLDSLNAGFVLAPETNLSAPVTFAPLEPGTHFGQVTYTNPAGSDTLAVSRFRGDGRDLGFLWANMDEYGDPLSADLDSVVIEISLADFVATDGARLYYARGGDIIWSAMEMDLVVDDPVNDMYRAAFPTAIGNERGLKFYVEVRNGPVTKTGPGASAPINIQVENPDLFIGALPAMEYRIISVPADLTGTTIAGMFMDDGDLGGKDPKEWRMFAYNPAWPPELGTYEEIPNDTFSSFEQGAGYWLISADGVELSTYPEQPVKTTPTSSPFRLEIEAGWNMISSPFAFRVGWNDILAATEEAGFATDMLSGVLWAYHSAYDSVRVLEPFSGAFVRSTESATLLVPPFEYTDDPQGKTAGEIAVEAQSITIRARCRTVVSQEIGALLVSGASAGFDLADRHLPPASPGPAIVAHFPHTDWGLQSGALCRDVRDWNSASAGEAASDGQEWIFDFAKNFSHDGADDEVVLEFGGVETLRGDVQAILVDLALSRRVDLREADTYVLYAGERDFVDESAARFRLLVGSEEFVARSYSATELAPVATNLRPNRPNPFNPATTIRFDLHQESHVRLGIYDLRGALVRELVDAEHPAGGHEVQWRGDDRQGRRVAAGVYFCRMETNHGFRATSKLLLAK